VLIYDKSIINLHQFILISKGSEQSVPGLTSMAFCDVLLHKVAS
jgi:hypothetical protein